LHLADVMPPLHLRAALRRGFVLVIANWPVVLIDFSVSAFAHATLLVPVAAGALMVGTLVGTNLGVELGMGIVPAAEMIFRLLASSPEALIAFALATAIVWLGAELLVGIIKGGTLSVIVEADRAAGELGRRVIGTTEMIAAGRFSAERVVDGARRFVRPMSKLAVVRSAWYLVLAGGYLMLLAAAVTAGPFSVSGAAWSAVVLVATSTVIVGASAINLACDLARVAIVTDECSLRVAFGRVRRFVVEDARQVIGIVSVIAGIQIVAASVALLAAAGLAPVAYLPVVSVAVIPLQIAFWILRGLVFELASLSSVAACQTQYRRYSSVRFGAGRSGGGA
jgi:hypothetical protein